MGLFEIEIESWRVELRERVGLFEIEIELDLR